ncbi:hypothetical protein GE061_000737 [Apolygus lucorum]|uniref:Uncharacterized protein n=1 Tax=Apolygus lucorum TaxID=248454 RepID=A0A6A4KAI4_APOLU|nr:hypothetical protein GE061_000737 [Apolygus lucorum]
MDDNHTGLSQDAFSTIPLSPIPESSCPDITEKMASQVAGSIFDPPGDHEIHSEPYLTSEATQPSSSSSNFESEGVLTRSKTGTSKRTTITPEEENCDTTVKKARKIKRPRERPSKGTQVMPRMLPPVKKRAPKKTNSEDSVSKENIPPKVSKKQRASKAAALLETEENLMPPLAPKKHSLTRDTEIHNLSGGVKRRLSASPPLNESSHTDEDNAVPYESSLHDSSALLPSSNYPANSSSMYGIHSLPDDENIRVDNDARKIVPRSLNETVLSTSSKSINSRSNKRNQPMAVILDQDMFKEGGTIEIKLNNGGVIVSSKQGITATPDKKREKKNEMNKRGGRGRKSRGGRRSHKDSWTSSDSESSGSESSCSCSSCDPNDSYCSTCDGSTSSSSETEDDHCHRCRHR